MSEPLSGSRLPDLEQLVACGADAARAMGQREAAPDRARTFFRDVLLRPQDEGGTDLWGCLTAGIITESEARDAVIARFATWLSSQNAVDEPPSIAWCSAELEHRFELAILGRPAQ